LRICSQLSVKEHSAGVRLIPLDRENGRYPLLKICERLCPECLRGFRSFIFAPRGASVSRAKDVANR
jgi:hypothetical protein